MLPTSAKDVERFDAPDADTTYLIATPSLLERAAYRRELAGAGAVYPSDAELLDAVRDDLRAVDPVNLGALLETLDLFEAQGADAADDVKADVLEMEGLVLPLGGRYSAARAARQHFLEVAPIIAARRFLLGVEGEDAASVPFKRVGQQTSDETLEALPPGHLMLIWLRAVARMQTTDEQKKASVSPSPSPTSPPRSKAAPKRPTVRRGKSTGNGTSAIRA